MGKKNSLGNLKKTITYTILACRIALSGFLFRLYDIHWLIDSELVQLLYITLPMTLLYFVFIIKYAWVRKRYYAAGQIVGKAYLISSIAPLMLLHLIEMLLVGYKSSIYESNPGGLYWSIAICECLLGAYTGFFLSDLFNNHYGEDSSTDLNQ